MPYLTVTLTENLKLQISPGLVASYDIQPVNGVGLFWDKHTHVYLLTYLPRTHTHTQSHPPQMIVEDDDGEAGILCH